MLGAGGIGGDIRQVDVGGGYAGQLNLCLLGSLLQTLHGNLIGGQVNAILLLELGSQVIHDPLVEVVAAQMGVAGSGQNLDDALADVQDGYIEGTAAQVIDHDLLVLFLVNTVSQSSCGGLVDDTLDVQTGNLTGVLGGLTLGVVEVCGHGDNSLGDLLAQISLGVGLQLLEDHCGNLLGGVALAVNGDLVVGAHLTLDGSNGAVGVLDGLTLCNLTNHTLAVFSKCNHRGGGTAALGVCDDNRLAAFHYGDTAVCST